MGYYLMSSLMLDLEGLELTSEERELLQHPLVGGVILFSRNYTSPAQLKELVHQIRTATPRYILIAVDQEGGRVQRLRDGFTRFPPAQTYGQLYDQEPILAKQQSQQAGYLLASELLAHHIDFSFAPVLDIGSSISEVIGDRAFHHTPEGVSELAGAFCQGMHEAGMSTVGKHFPGHGSVAADSHTEIPIDLRSYSEIMSHDLIPFQQLIAQSCLDGIMPAHVIYSELDAKPACFSRYWIQTILREQCHFDGAIFSDDLTMEGASIMGNMVDRAEYALEAGCDMILVCNQRSAAIAVLDALKYASVPQSEARLMRMRVRK